MLTDDRNGCWKEEAFVFSSIFDVKLEKTHLNAFPQMYAASSPSLNPA